MSLDVYLVESVPSDVFEANITHNLGMMAREAGVYDALWRPGEDVRAKDILPTLKQGLKNLRYNPERYIAFNPPNGWGDYSTLVNFLTKYIRACEDYPNARVRVSR